MLMDKPPLDERVTETVKSFKERTSRLKKETKLNEP